MPVYAKWFRRRGLKTLIGRRAGNFGDDLNPFLINLLSGEKPTWVNKHRGAGKVPTYIVVGSILHWADEKSVVWGAGFASQDARVQGPPIQVCAVRGPLSRACLLEQGIQCPSVFGDPALLLPLFVEPSANKRYKLGIVPHYAELKNSEFVQWAKKHCNTDRNEILVIDVSKSVERVVEEITMCESIASTSLHGLIVADAYKIPSVHVSYGGFVPHSEFKFYDYFESVNKQYCGALAIRLSTSIDDIVASMHEEAIEIDIHGLLQSCPFKRHH